MAIISIAMGFSYEPDEVDKTGIGNIRLGQI